MAADALCHSHCCHRIQLYSCWWSESSSSHRYISISHYHPFVNHTHLPGGKKNRRGRSFYRCCSCALLETVSAGIRSGIFMDSYIGWLPGSGYLLLVCRSDYRSKNTGGERFERRSIWRHVYSGTQNYHAVDFHFSRHHVLCVV